MNRFSKSVNRTSICLIIAGIILAIGGCSNGVISTSQKQPPGFLTTEMASLSVELTWGKSEAGEETEYEIWRSTTSESEYIRITTVDCNVTDYTDTSVELFADYYYKVLTVYGGETGEFSNVSSINTNLALYAVEHFYGTASIFNPKNGGLIGTLALPGKDRAGIAWDGQYLYSTCWKYDTIYKIDPESGDIISSFPSPGNDPLYLTWDGESLWNLDSNYQSGFATLYKIDPVNGSEIASYVFYGVLDGITFDGTYIWLMDNSSGEIKKVDPVNGNVIETITCPYSFWGIAHDGLLLWGAEDNCIRCINPDTGEEVFSFSGELGNSLIIGLTFVRGVT